MSEIKKPIETHENSSGDVYADIPGKPYPDTPRKEEEMSAWFEGQKKIFARMRRQEREAALRLEEQFAQVRDQEGFDALCTRLDASALGLEGSTVSVRDFTVTSPAGRMFRVAVLFKPRRDIRQKDEKLIYGILKTEI